MRADSQGRRLVRISGKGGLLSVRGSFAPDLSFCRSSGMVISIITPPQDSHSKLRR